MTTSKERLRVLMLKLSEEEKAAINAAAQRAGMWPGTWARQVLVLTANGHFDEPEGMK